MEDEMKDKDRKSGSGKNEMKREEAGKNKTSRKPPEKKKEEPFRERFIVSSSPHIHDGRTTSSIMRLVIFALLPAALFSIYIFGVTSLRVIVISICSALVFELLALRIMKRPVNISDDSAFLTGLLLALNLPPGSPWWLVVTGTFFAIVVAKQIFGGLGYNPFNPALIGRVVLLVSFPVHMTRWIAPSAWGADAVTTATPLGRMAESLDTLGHIDMDLIRELFSREEIINLLIGNTAGCIGEVSIILLAAGGIFLIAKKVISWHIPVSFIGSVWLLTGIFYKIDPAHYINPTFHVLSGGLFLGAIFMATDYVTSPMTSSGKIIFGIGCGLITVLIRLFGVYPEGVSFAILLMNAATPLIDRYTKPKVFGARKAA
ncbi:MAG: RnfABCDGE type electron transport complex subunit D [Candidatus Krumholzibacteriota bacterium]|nr:RnfABCDGE type electron transport complex subunit D [Candidatus Krumholzibacteriota bacterium]